MNKAIKLVAAIVMTASVTSMTVAAPAGASESAGKLRPCHAWRCAQ